MNDTQYMLCPARFENESYEDYKKRRAVANGVVKKLSKGRYFYTHDINPITGKRVPYVKS